jgi:anti-anti-sigma factor
VSRYQIARSGALVYVRAEGLANMKNAPLLHAFLMKARDEGVRSVYIDLSATTGMDSTFMGLMVGMSQCFFEVGGRVAIVRPSPQAYKLLKTLGVDEVVTVVPSAEDVPTAEYLNLEGDADLGQRERAELIRQAHQHLAGINDGNRAKFAAFLQALDNDLKKRG